MTSFSRFVRSALPLICGVVLMSAAHAQMPGGGMGGGMGGGRHGHAQSDGDSAKHSDAPAGREKSQFDTSELAQIRLDNMLDALNPDANLSPLWKAYASKVLLVIEDQKRWKQRAIDGKSQPERLGPAPKAMEQQMDELRDRLTALEDINAAGKMLYEKLDMRQRAVADQHMALVIGYLAHNDSAMMMAGPMPTKKP